jgi:hypothetical protein
MTSVSSPAPFGSSRGAASRVTHSAAAPEAAARPPRRGHRVPTVRELPRRWDPRTAAEVVVYETD